jgi:PAS domain S-box-containing protein
MADRDQASEQRRLRALAAYDILDTAPEADFDELVELAAELCETPIALISLIDARRQWFKARHGVEVTETPREISFCTWALDYPDLLEVADARRDSRFADNPLVAGESGVRFYAGAPLRTPEGYALGTLCVIDHVPRVLTERQRRVLIVLARQVMHQLELRRRLAEEMRAEAKLREAERVLQESSELMAIASDAARIGGWRLELFPRRVVWSEDVRRIHEVAEGYQPELSTALAFYPPHERRRVAGAIDACSADGMPFDLELQLVTARGRTIWVRCIGRPQRDADGRIVAIQGAFQDIDAPKRNELALEQVGRQLQTTLESISDALFTLDRDWRFTYLNQRAEQLLMRAREELLGKVVWDEFGVALETAFYVQYQRAMRDGETVSFVEYYEPLATWFDVTAYPTPEGIAVYFRDVSEKIELEARLAQVQKLEAIGRLTGGVAHDFNNLLTVIIGNAELLAEELGADHPAAPIVDLVCTAADRGAELTSRLLASARRQALEPRVVAPAAVIDGMGALLRRTLGETVEVDLFHEPGLWPVFVDTTQLETALINLCVNARDAMPQGGKLTIETANVVLDESYAVGHAEVEPGSYVQISVSDTGIGMSPEQLARAFEPFFTTKPKGKGTGLGLSMVYGFVRQSGGHVNLYSEEGVGTVVHLYLPRADSEAVEPVVATAAAPQSGAGERILLVEDDALVREHALRLLRDLGYRVTEAASGIEALTLLRDGLQVDLLFTDVIMPGGLTGPQLAAAARALLPALPVLYTSGYTENAIVHHGRVDPGVLLLHKPYRRATLAEKIRQALHAAPATHNDNNE